MSFTFQRAVNNLPLLHAKKRKKIGHDTRQFLTSVELTCWFFDPGDHKSHFGLVYKVLCIHVCFSNSSLPACKVHNASINRSAAQSIPCYRTVDLGHFDMHFLQNFKLL